MGGVREYSMVLEVTEEVVWASIIVSRIPAILCVTELQLFLIAL